MFRLVFMTFHGDRHHDAHASDHGSHAPDHGPRTTDHGHSAHLHDAPPAMAFALVVLAAGSILAGFVGVPQAIYGQGSRIQRFLDRSFEAPATAPATPGFQVIEGRAGTRVEVGAADSVPEPPEVSKRTEQGLMAVSVLTALAGIFVAMFFWLRNRTAAARVARSVAPIYTLLLN